jgi:hypothetical protein
MTNKQPEPEQMYLVSKEQIHKWMEYNYSAQDIANEAQSRPYHPAPEPTQKYLDCKVCEDEIQQSEREKAFEKLKDDLKTRFISSGNQWSKGRNSGLLECCNIIDESLRKVE